MADSKVEQIVQNQINKSKSKHTYSFSKGQRFEGLKFQGSRTFHYDMPEVRNRRSTSFGCGKKFDMIIKHINKRTPYYDMPSEFNTSKPKSPAFSFGIGREYYDKVNI